MNMNRTKIEKADQGKNCLVTNASFNGMMTGEMCFQAQVQYIPIIVTIVTIVTIVVILILSLF